MASTPPDSSVLPLEEQIVCSTVQSIANSLPEKQVAISPPEQQVATTSDQQVAISNTNGQVMEYKDSQSNQQLVQQRDQTNSLSLISSSVSKMEKISSSFKSNLDQLNNITSDLPNKSSDTNSDSSVVNKVYSDFRTSISEIGCAYSELLEEYHSFQFSFNSVKTQLGLIYQQIFEKIKTNQVLSDKFLDTQRDKLVKAETEIANLLKIQENFKIELKKKGFQKQTSLVLSTINKVEQFTHKKEEVEKFNTELVRRDGLLNVEKSKLELIDIEMNFSKQQEERLEKDYKATLAKKQELTDKNQQQQKDLEALGNDNKKMIAHLEALKKKNVTDKEQMSQSILQEHFNRNQSIEKMFANTLKEINDLQITQSSRGFIIVLDESDSMSGTPFQNCVHAIKEQVKYLKSKFPDDEFCMIQFDSRARITINKSAVQFVNEAEVGKKFNGGGTDFYFAFRQVKDVMPLFECKVINIMFVTDGGDSNTAAYLKVLQEIKQEYPNNKFQLFGLAFGSCVSADNIKDCLKEVNGNPLTITSNGKKIQSYFEVNVAEDLIKAFKNMFEAQSASVEEFNAKDKKRREMIAQQQADAEKMKATLLKQFDDEYGLLTTLLEKLQGDNQNSQTKGQNALLDILNQQTGRLNTQLAEQEKEMEDLKRVKKDYLEKIKEVQNGITTLEMERENFRISAGSLVDKSKITQDVQEYEEEIRRLGFSSKNHYDQLKGRLTNAGQIEKALTNFSSQMTASMSHLNQIREFVYDGIDQISENIETKESDIQFQLSDLIERSMQRVDPNQKLDGLSPAEKMKFLIMTTSKEEYTRILEDKELNYPFENLYSALELSDLFKLQKAQQKKGTGKKDNQSLTVDQYLERVFKEIFGLKESTAKIPGMARIQDKIAQLEESIAAEEKKDDPSDSKLERFQQQKEQLEERLGEFQEKIEIKKQENEEVYLQFIDKHRRQYDFTRNVIRNIRQAIQLIEYKSRQTNIFQPLQMQCFALEMLSQQCSQINQLAIE